MSIRILVADDHKVVREGLCALLSNEPNMQVVGEAGDGRTTMQLAGQLLPDVVIMDITMPDLNGVEATRQIIAQAPHVKVVALSIHSDKRFVVGMLKAGALGYLLKDCAFEELASAIRSVVANRTYLSPSIADGMIKGFVNYLSVTEPWISSVLTPKEKEVLQLLAEGKRTKEISLQLQVSVKTIETHRERLMHKLGIRSIAELTKFAIREGLTPL